MIAKALILSACFVTLTLASSIVNFPGISCAVVLCAQGTTCIDTPRGPQCVPITPPPVGGCETVRCGKGKICIETPAGPQCVQDTGCAAVTCLVGSECIVTPTGPKCVPIDDCVCTEEFNPVCCKSSTGEIKTAENPCKCNGCDSSNKIISEGACPPSSCALVDCAPGFKCVEKGGEAKCVRANRCICTKELNPVCCKTSSGFEKKPNPCTCTCLPGARIVPKYKCLLTKPRPDCICPAVYDPVCCKTSFGGVSKVSNSCQCGCAGGIVVPFGCGIHE